MTRINYPKDCASGLKGTERVFILAPKKILKSAWLNQVLPKSLAARTKTLTKLLLAEEAGKGRETSVADNQPTHLTVISLPDTSSRHNSPTRKEEIASAFKTASLGRSSLVIVGLDHEDHLVGALTGVARSLPLFDRRTGGKKKQTRVSFVALSKRGAVISCGKMAREAFDSVRIAASLIDTPAGDLSTADFAREARKLVKGLANVQVRVIAGAELKKAKLNGIATVGAAATHPPRLVILDYRPPKAKHTVSLVGKGVVYDTGGLSLKTTAGMCGMKADMGGAAAVLGAFRVLAATGSKHRIVALLPLAENSVGPNSYRPDDIIRMHSGHTVEINNTDAEGRLLLADAVSYAARTYRPLAVIDAATLTGAQLIATGDRHAAVMSNREGLERLAFEAGRGSGDLTFPLPFAPEFYQSEFRSKVADMKNSVKNRMNAQSSCAAQFVYSHIDDLDVPWLHIDLAGPAFRGERATGYGVALIARIVDQLTEKTVKT